MLYYLQVFCVKQIEIDHRSSYDLNYKLYNCKLNSVREPLDCPLDTQLLT